MDYSIYTYGGGELLHGVINGIALLFQSNNPYFTSVGTFAALLGVIGAGIHAIPRASFPIVFKEWFMPTILISTLLFGPKTAVHIIDEVDPHHKYEKIDGVPIGISAIGSLFSTISKHATETVETAFFTSEANRMSKVGPMFAAQLVHQARLITIKDPITRENLKDFVRQCYAWPYVFGNITPGKKAALESTSILDFIAQNPHPGLGIYWRESNGTTSFKSCAQCLQPVRESLTLETQNAFMILASSLLPGQSRSVDEEASARLKQYMGEAWTTIAKGSSNAAEVIQQELMINSYKEMLADKRDELGLGRFDSNLIHLNTMRGQASQNASFLSVTSLVGQNLPHMHASFFAIALILFALIAPWTFAMGGFQLIKIWLKVMASIAIWPVLYAVLSCIGTMWAAKAGMAATMGTGSLNLLTQNGLGDAAYNTYCWVMSLQAITPFLAWAVISRGEQAFSQMTSSFTQTSEAFAARAGSEMVDGNVSFDTQSIGNHTVANAQVAQQQLGASINSGMRFDDGKIAAIHGPYGQVTIQEHQTQLGTNIMESNAANQMIALQSQFSQMAASQERVGLQTAISAATNEAVSGIKSFAANVGINEFFGDSVSSQVGKQAQELLGLAEKIGKQNNLSTEAALSLGVGANMGASLGGNIGGSINVGSSDTEVWGKVKDTDLGKQFTQNWQKLNQFVHDNRGSIGNSEGIQHLDNMQTSFNKAETHSRNLDAHLQTSKTWSEMASATTSTGTSATTNANDKYLLQVANDQFGGNVSLAAQSMISAGEIQDLGIKAVNHASQHLPPNLGPSQGIQDFYYQEKSRIDTPPTKADLESQRKEYNISGQSETLGYQVEDMKNNAVGNNKHLSGKITDQKENISEGRQESERNFDKRKDQPLIRKAAEKVVDHMGAIISGHEDG